jgi:rhodanese-related sulfurtransferase
MRTRRSAIKLATHQEAEPMNRRWLITFAGALALLASPTAFSQSELVESTVESVPGATTVDSAAAKKLSDSGAVFVDLRKAAAYDAGRVPGSLHLDFKQGFSKEALEAKAKKDDSVVFYCSGVKCPRSAAACEQAVGWGYKKVYYYREGFPGWQQAGYPAE